MSASVKVQGVRNCKLKLESIIERQAKRAEIAMNSCLDEVLRHSADYAPIDTGTLLDSREKSVTRSGTQVVGAAYYRTGYADALENRKVEWKPRTDKNPNARRGFLRLGAEDEGQKEKLDKIVKRIMKL